MSRQTTNTATPTILAVDDLPEYLQLYEARLDDYDVRTAGDGESAIETIDEDVDVVLLDRSMPDVPGDDVLAYIREEGYDCQVAMVTAVEPDTDIVELGFDAYLVKPVSGDRLVDTVERLLRRSRYEDELEELYALCSQRAALAAEGKTENEEYAELSARIEELRRSVDYAVTEFSPDDYRATFRDIPEF
ncbi:response regulator [Halarchaeum sp. P4]|uniref:response regulator n=1 Tax=Halarchaeum sp. P4 TaxID=3421639 RepID=UPI003EB94BCE